MMPMMLMMESLPDSHLNEWPVHPWGISKYGFLGLVEVKQQLHVLNNSLDMSILQSFGLLLGNKLINYRWENCQTRLRTKNMNKLHWISFLPSNFSTCIISISIPFASNMEPQHSHSKKTKPHKTYQRPITSTESTTGKQKTQTYTHLWDLIIPNQNNRTRAVFASE